MSKTKVCHFCKKEVAKLWYSRPPCCASGYCKSKYSKEKDQASGSTPKKPKVYRKEPTGELKLFLKIYAERKGVCEVTKRVIPFDVNNFAHILSKGAYVDWRLEPSNIIHVCPEIHDMYDKRPKKSLLSKYPEAEIIYQRKIELKRKYYESKKIPNFKNSNNK